jgi:general nucleoside transport system permease protein
LKLLGTVVITVVGLMFVLAITLLTFGVPVADGFSLLAEGAFGDRFGWSRTAVKMTPLLLTGLGMIVAWRAGMYNIGGEGQFIIGGIFSAVLARAVLRDFLSLPPLLTLVLFLVLSSLGGAAWAWLAGWLYVRRGIDVVISTILLNFVAVQALGYVSSGPLRANPDGVPLTDLLPYELMLYRPNPQMDFHAGVPVAVFASLVVFVYLFRSRAGFQVRLVGENPRVARANRMDTNKLRLQAMLVSGALCGLAGGIEYAGMARQLGMSFSQNWGFLGIPVALLGGLHPLLAVPSAFFFGALFAGSENLSRFTQSGPTLVYIVQAVAVLAFVSVRVWIDRRSRRAVVPATS